MVDWNPAIDHVSYLFFYFVNTFLVFNSTSKRFFDENVVFFGKREIFSQKNHFSNVNETHCSFLILFEKLTEIFGFSWKNREKVYKLQVC